MDKLIKKIIEAYESKYGKKAKMREGETQVFLLEDCVAVLTFEDGNIDVKITADEPIISDYSSDLFNMYGE